MNAKVERTKRAFQEAFCRLIQTTPAAQITVSELCREAGLNRSTFYRHYAIPLDVITDAVREILAQGDLPPQPMTRQTLYDFLLRSCTLWYQNKALFGVCLHCGGDLMLLLYRSLRLQEQIDRWELGSALDSFVFGGHHRRGKPMVPQRVCAVAGRGGRLPDRLRVPPARNHAPARPGGNALIGSALHCTCNQ